MLPPAGGNGMDKLRAAVGLSLSEDFRDARHAYFTWFRDFITPLRRDDLDRVRTGLDPASIKVAQSRLRELWAHEVAAAKKVAFLWELTQQVTDYYGGGRALA